MGFSLCFLSAASETRTRAEAPSEINVIGATAEEACERVDKFLDAAYVAGRLRLRVIHGHGKGILKRSLHEMFASHAHVDKSWWGLPWQSWSGERGVAGRIAHERERRDELGIPGVARTSRVLAEMVRHGTTAIRTHVDVRPVAGGDRLAGLDALVALRERLQGTVDLQLCLLAGWETPTYRQ